VPRNDHKSLRNQPKGYGTSFSREDLDLTGNYTRALCTLDV